MTFEIFRAGKQFAHSSITWKETGLLYMDKFSGGDTMANTEVVQLLADPEIPALIQEQVKAAIIGTISDCQESHSQNCCLDAAPSAYQVRVSIAKRDEKLNKQDYIAPRWGFFLVHKVFDSLEPRQLLLDVYLYQE